MTVSPLPISSPQSDPAPVEPRWSARRTLAFVVTSSLALWAGVIAILRLSF